MDDFFSPGEVVERSGFSADTIRYYERIGLLPQIKRGPSGHRRFGSDDLEWLRVLGYLRDTGMPISDMLRYATLARRGDETIPERLALLVEHDARVEHRIEHLTRQRMQVLQKIGWYRAELSGDEATG